MRLSPDVPIKETNFDFTPYGIEMDAEGYGILADTRYGRRVVVSDTDWLNNIKPNIKEGLKNNIPKHWGNCLCVVRAME